MSNNLPGKYVKLKVKQKEDVLIENPPFGLESIPLITAYCVLVFAEGVLDALTLHQLGVASMASCGGRFSKAQEKRILRLLMRLLKKHPKLVLIIWFDYDPKSKTGQKATLDFARKLLKKGITCRIVMLSGPEKVDINDLFVREGTEAINRELKKAQDYLQFRLDAIKEVTSEQQHKLASELLYDLLEGEFDKSVIKLHMKELGMPTGIVNDMLHEQRKKLLASVEIKDRRPVVELPGGPVEIQQTGRQLSKLFSSKSNLLDRLFNRNLSPVKLIEDENNINIKTVSPEAMCSEIEKVGRLVKTSLNSDGEKKQVSTVCSIQNAKAILASDAFIWGLPVIKQVLSCPMPVVRPDGSLDIITGYDERSGILAKGEILKDIPLHDAVALIESVFVDFNFQTPSDKARAFSAIITPMLAFSGILNGRAPMFFIEADDSQAGKGFLVKIITAFYLESPAIVTQQERGGTGSLQEQFNSHLIAGKPFISFDNLRGKLDSQSIESFLTEDSYNARIPYSEQVIIDPSKTILLGTSNKVNLTVDQANRCCLIRIKKQSGGYQFREFTEGSIIDIIRQNQPTFLGAVYSIIKNYYNGEKQ